MDSRDGKRSPRIEPVDLKFILIPILSLDTDNCKERNGVFCTLGILWIPIGFSSYSESLIVLFSRFLFLFRRCVWYLQVSTMCVTAPAPQRMRAQSKSCHKPTYRYPYLTAFENLWVLYMIHSTSGISQIPILLPGIRNLGNPPLPPWIINV